VTSAGEGRAAGCEAPLDAALLVDYWLGLAGAADEEAVESHLFACDACGDRLRAAVALATRLRDVARSGGLRVVVGEALVRRAQATGRRVRRYEAAPAETIHCTAAVDDELFVARLAADLRGAARVDLSLCDPEGVERQRLVDVPAGEGDGVFLQESVAFAKLSPTTTMIARLLAVDDRGAERLLGEYRFQHTRTIPGPPGWEW
jgi:hypothetical protein